MADALALQIADAVVTEIAGHPWLLQPEAFTPSRLYYAKYKIEDLATVKVSVIPLTEEDEKETRSKRTYDFVTWIDVQKRLTAFDSKTEADALVNFMDEMKRFFADEHRLGGSLTAYRYEKAAYFQGQFWTPELLYSAHVFEAAIELTIRGIA